jgi:hypothetical protein
VAGETGEKNVGDDSSHFIVMAKQCEDDTRDRPDIAKQRLAVGGAPGSRPKAMVARRCPYRAVAGRDSLGTVAPP